VEYATLDWVDWLNHRRLPELIGDIPPPGSAEILCRKRALAEEAGLKQLSLP
jgi:hypothetical protein